MVDKSLPELVPLLQVAMESAEIQQLFHRVRPAKEEVLAELRDELVQTLDEQELWTFVEDERVAFQQFVIKVDELEERLTRQFSPEYAAKVADARQLDAAIAEHRAKRDSVQRKKALAHSELEIQRLSALMDQVLAKPAREGWITRITRSLFRRGRRDDSPDQELDEELRRYDNAIRNAEYTRSELRSHLFRLRLSAEQRHQNEPSYVEACAELDGARRELEAALVQKALLPHHLRPRLTARLDQQTREYYGLELLTTDAPGLAFLDDRQYDVRTKSRDALIRLTENLDGGSIGLSGARGAGKTTLLHALTEPGRVFRGRVTAVSVLVPAPVEYLPKEFVLHLFHRVCEGVLAKSTGERRNPPPAPPPLLGFAAMALLLAGATGWFLTTVLSRPPHFANVALLPALGALLPLALPRSLNRFVFLARGWDPAVFLVLTANAGLALVWVVQLGSAPARFAWLAWATALCLLALPLRWRRWPSVQQVALPLLTSVPLVFGGITENWATAVVGAVLVLCGSAVGTGPGERWQTEVRVALAPVLLVAGTVLITAAGARTRIDLLAIVSVAAMLVAAAMHHWLREQPDQVPPSAPRQWADRLADEARRHINEIRYQLTESTTWSKVLKASTSGAVAVGVDSSSGGGTSRQAIARTYPEIVESFREFLAKVCAHGPVVIAVDEIDKLAPDAAGKFLNDVKAIFGVPGCYYLVSLSEDAMASFERRGLPIRDVFDSSFDDVVHVGHLTADECQALLTERVAGLPLAVHGLCHVMSGGLPRDLIRVARRVFTAAEINRTRSIQVIAEQVVLDDLAERCRGVVMSASGLSVETAGEVLALLERGRVIHDSYDDLPQVGLPAADPLRRTLVTLFAYNYLLSTLVSFLSGADTAGLQDAASANSPRCLAKLAQARQLTAVDSSLAWAQISAFRSAAGLRPLTRPTLFSRVA